MSDNGPTIDHDERVARLRDEYMDASVRMMGAANKFRQLSEMAQQAQQEAMEAATEQEAAFREWHQATLQRLAAESVKRDIAELPRLLADIALEANERGYPGEQTPAVERPIHTLHYYLDSTTGQCARCDLGEDNPIHAPGS